MRSNPKDAVGKKTVVKLLVREEVQREFEVVFPIYTRTTYSAADGDQTIYYHRMEGHPGQRTNITIRGLGTPHQEFTLEIFDSCELIPDDVAPELGGDFEHRRSNREEFETAWRLVIDALTSLA